MKEAGHWELHRIRNLLQRLDLTQSWGQEWTDLYDAVGSTSGIGSEVVIGHPGEHLKKVGPEVC